MTTGTGWYQGDSGEQKLANKALRSQSFVSCVGIAKSLVMWGTIELYGSSVGKEDEVVHV